MPVFGYLLLLNEHVHGFLVIQYDTGWPFNYLPSLWRVWLLFCRSFFLAVGSMLFAWFCPAEIKQYTSPYIFADAERSHRVATERLKEQTVTQLASLYNGMSGWENLIFEMPRLRPDLPNLGAGESPGLRTGDQLGPRPNSHLASKRC
jgi:hypothetical protein